MNADPVETIRLQLGEQLNQEFCDYIKTQPVYQQNSQHVTIEQIAVKRPATGFGLTVPPEVIIALGKGFAGAIGAGLGNLVWEWLKGFFSNPSRVEQTPMFKVIVNGSEFMIEASRIPLEPPSIANVDDK